MKKKVVKHISFLVTSILMLVLIAVFTLRDMPDKVYTNNEIETTSVFDNISPLNKITYNEDSVDISFMGLIPLKSVEVQNVKDLKLYPGGTSVGVRLSSNGVLVIGFSDLIFNDSKIESPAKISGIELGDVIIKINGKNVYTTKEILNIVKNTKGDTINVTLDREGKNIEKTIKMKKEKGENKIGLWIRDSTAGVGTLTFYDEASGKFGALGHPITDGDTNTRFTVKSGELLEASVISLRKGEKGMPGELKGIFTNEDNPIGHIHKNTQCGIFGTQERFITRNKVLKPLPVGIKEEVKVGKAKIITTIDEKGPKEYDIEIVKKLNQDSKSPKSMIIKVTDEELLQKTGGIIQGMSGSPIIQDGKIIGAVTHVLINKPDVGYGIYIDWMLEDAGIIKK
ncbi:SpoIVB peptidase [Eubacterium multiforme]|uniref:Stage IV sporulation protein B n=1 Tax=Eubacterium multiforme TaxID=83339 RepID=A0ABT9USG7_9FIRM|nr:SpoIVB peptidase [Eubacterium multiforme]MDQ0149250.1 stage IV sporulation protein B [Eubacterium multiforme]